MEAYYHSVDTFGTVDGKGIRYVLFLTGCALGCRFCHNPDTWGRGNKTITVEKVLADYKRYRVYYDASGGGVTVSGGEPLTQAVFVAELFAACRREKIHTTLDTSGYADRKSLDLVLPETDAVLFGLKAATDQTYRRLTTAGSSDIIANLRYIGRQRVSLTVRYILIPGINDSVEEIAVLASLVSSLPSPVTVELLPYHQMGKAKWEALGLTYSLPDILPPAESEVRAVRDTLIKQGIQVI